MGLDIVELIMEVERTFDVSIPDDEASTLSTVGKLFDCVLRKLDPARSVDATGPYEGALWERYLDVVRKDSGVDRAELVPGARFVLDLNLD